MHKHTESHDFLVVIGSFQLEITWTDSNKNFLL